MRRIRKTRRAATQRTSLLLAMGLLAGCGTQAVGTGSSTTDVGTGSGTMPSAATAGTSEQGSASAPHVLADGDIVMASGRVVSVSGAPVRFCAPTPVAAIGYAPGTEPAPAGCDGFGVDVVGADLSVLDRRREKDGAVEGWAQLRGTYRQGTLTVSEQRPPVDDAVPTPEWNEPPCPRPDDGWSGTADVAAYQAYAQAHPGEVASLGLFRPTASTSVLVLAVQHLDSLRAALPADPAAVCVVPSRYSADEIAAATRAL